MPLDPAKIDQLVGQLSYLTERLEHMELKTRGDAVNPTQRGVADRTRKDAAGGYAPIEPHQAGFVPEARADAARRKR
jgi:hypothetical protein